MSASSPVPTVPLDHGAVPGTEWGFPPPPLPPAQPDNGPARVTEWRFAPGAATGHHRHAYPYVVVPMTTGRLTITGADGVSTAELRPGPAHAPPAGAGHAA